MWQNFSLLFDAIDSEKYSLRLCDMSSLQDYAKLTVYRHRHNRALNVRQRSWVVSVFHETMIVLGLFCFQLNTLVGVVMR